MKTLKIISYNIICILLFMHTLYINMSYANDDQQFEKLNMWVGKAPFEEINGVSFWDFPLVKTYIEKSLGKKYFNIFKKHLLSGVVSVVVRDGDVIHTSTCKAHACYKLTANIYFNIKTNIVYICWHEHELDNDIWLSSNGASISLDKNDSCISGDDIYFYDKYSSMK